jgi:hypothetical protein
MIKLNTENKSPIKTKPELKSDIEESAASTRGNEAIPDSSEGRKSKRKKKHKKQKKAKNEAESIQVPVLVPKAKRGILIYFKIEIQAMALVLFYISFITAVAMDFNHTGIINIIP